MAVNKHSVGCDVVCRLVFVVRLGNYLRRFPVRISAIPPPILTVFIFLMSRAGKYRNDTTSPRSAPFEIPCDSSVMPLLCSLFEMLAVSLNNPRKGGV